MLTLRGAVAMIGGGFLVGFGSSYAGGCTSGHGVVGLASLWAHRKETGAAADYAATSARFGATLIGCRRNQVSERHAHSTGPNWKCRNHQRL